jgi:hypothetical protein
MAKSARFGFTDSLCLSNARRQRQATRNLRFGLDVRMEGALAVRCTPQLGRP